MNQENDRSLLKKLIHEPMNSLKISPFKHRSISVRNEDETEVRGRDYWNSDDHYSYFKWALLKRQPMELLVGRTRSVKKPIFGLNKNRLNTGIWRSGLVG